MSVDRFARLDSNEDGMLEASELNRKSARRAAGPSIVEQVVVARFADYLTAKPEAVVKPDGAKVAEAVLARLDKDGSGGVNSEEIAGTRLAEKLGSGFYEADGDKNGALDKDELKTFISNAYLGEDEVGEGADPVAVDDGAEGDVTASAVDANTPAVSAAPVEADEPATSDISSEPGEVVEASGAQSTAAASEPTSSTSYADQVHASFEAALEVLKNGADQRSAYDVVRTLYAEVSGIIGEA